MKEGTPYIGFDKQTLDNLPPLGPEIDCPWCGGTHEVDSASSDDGVMSLQFYDCGGSSYLAGIEGGSLMGTHPDVSGEI